MTTTALIGTTKSLFAPTGELRWGVSVKKVAQQSF